MAELDAARIEYSIDEGARAEGILRLDLNIPNEEGEPLKLQYIGQPSLALGNGHPPSDIPVVGGSGAGIAASCVP